MHNNNYSSLPPAGNIEASRERFRYCAKKGLLKHTIPLESGGHGDTFTDLVTAHEILGKECLDCGLLLSINAHIWGAIFPLLNYGTPQQKQTWLPGLLSGELIAGHAITEPQAGSDLNALEMKVATTDDGLLLNGHKRFITNTPIADMLVVYGKLENKLSAFIVWSDDMGANFLDSPNVTGCTSATMGDIVLENCLIPNNRQLGKTGVGTMMIQYALELERAFIFAGITGILDWQLNSVIQYSRERRVNNVHLGKNQGISHKIADMKLRLDTIRLWVNECSRFKDDNKRITLVSAQTKLFASEAFLQSSLDAVQVLGSSGLLEESLMARLVNDAMASRLFSGSSEIQKNIIAALLGTGDGYKG